MWVLYFQPKTHANLDPSHRRSYSQKQKAATHALIHETTSLEVNYVMLTNIT